MITNELMNIIKKDFKTLNNLKKYLKKNAVLEYGCKSFTLEIKNGIKLIYTDNKNCWSKFIVRYSGVGTNSEYKL